MALTFDFTNNPEDSKPELILKAAGATSAEKILLYNILNGAYGFPFIDEAESKSDNGMATQIKIGFAFPETPEEPEPEEPEEFEKEQG